MAEENCRNKNKEIDNNDDNADDDQDQHGTGAKFNCSYCKRGFTNPQALGGHMNIHRKDKQVSKSKPKPNPTVSKTASSMFCANTAIPSRHAVNFLPAIGAIAGSSSYSSDNLSYPCAPFHQYYPAQPSGYHYVVDHPYQFHVDHDQDDHDKTDVGDEDLDLELRLGPKS